ncbi:hypothetical protein K474DRAFT_1679170 [Panus rudis PR-1116 ss-1]|nr:hypothetical protein K474DRAFT_1679170 [Panus rudis PR-1116 ss-1]
MSISEDEVVEGAMNDAPLHPFTDEDADLIVKTSDNVYFRVYKVILGKVSPFFKQMFGLPQSPPSQDAEGEIVDGIPVISLSENSRVIKLLFTFCYPMDDPNLVELNDVQWVLEAAQKYQMEAICNRARKAWFAITDTYPLRAFAIACRMRWEDEARTAAKLTLKEPFWPLEPPLPDEFDYVSADNLLRLIVYHRKCCEAACELAGNTLWATQLLDSLVCAHCHKIYKSSTYALKLTEWARRYMLMAKSVLEMRPEPKLITRPEFVEETINQAYGQPPCELPMHCVGKINRLVELFAKELSDKIAAVPLDFKL